MISGDLTEGSVPEDQAAIRLVVNESRIIMNPPREGILKEVCSLTAREFIQRDKPPYDMTSFDVPEELFFRYTNRETGEKEVAILPGLLEEIKQYCQKYGITYHVKTAFVNPLLRPNIGATRGWRFKQKEFFTECITPNRSGIFVAFTRYGKSMCINELCTMYDYSLKKVQDVKVGDLLMGPDGAPRRVESLGSGEEEAYRVIPNKGEPFCCNKSHILSVKMTGWGGYPKSSGIKSGQIINLTIEDYLSRPNWFRHCAKLWYAPLDFQPKRLPFDPWIVGVWLGDGDSKNPVIYKPDRELQNEVVRWADSLGASYVQLSRKSEKDTIRITKGTLDHNPLGSIIRMCTVSKEKRIPVEYLTSSRDQRLELLAGLIDTDGCLNNGKGYEITTKYDGLNQDIIRLCRGLGFRVTSILKKSTIKSINFEGVYHRLQISGPIHEIPVRISRKKAEPIVGRVDPTLTGFRVEPIGIQPYYGFTLSGNDRLFLMWDHCVTHNTYQMENTIRAWDKDYRFLLVVPGLDNVAQLHDHMKKAFPDRNVRWIGGGKSAVPSSEAKANIIVTSMDSLHLWAGKEKGGKYEGRNIDFLLVDEPQDLPTPDRRVKFYNFPRARKYGYTATVEGRFDRRDKWITAIMGPVLGEKTYKEALAEGAVSEIVVVFLRIQMPFPFIWRSRRGAYNGMMFHSPEMAALNARLMTEIVPDDWQTMCFIKEEKQADVLTEALEKCEHRVAMAKLLSKKERLAITKMVRNDEIKRILATNIYVKGVTFHELKCLINMEGGGGNLNTIQKAGRLAEVRDGKKAGVLIDFFFEPSQGLKDEQERMRLRLANFRSGDSMIQPSWAFLYNDSMARYRVYQKRGFTIKFARTEEELKSIIKRYE